MKNLGSLALVLYFVFAVVFMFLVPPLETPDEGHHLNYINFVSRNLDLPNQYIPERSVIGEGHQYPLYYMAGAVLVRLLTSDHGVDLTDVPNKKHRLLGGDSLTVPSFRHAGVDIFKSASDRLAFHALRSLSVLFGLITIFFIYRLAKLFFDGGRGPGHCPRVHFRRTRPWIQATGEWRAEGSSLDEPYWAVFAALLAGTLPQFIFISMSISNDALSNALAAAGLFYMAKITVSKDSRRVWKDHLWLGVALGLGILTKKSGLVLLIPAAFVFIRSVWRRRSLVYARHPEHSPGSEPLGRPERSEGADTSIDPAQYKKCHCEESRPSGTTRQSHLHICHPERSEGSRLFEERSDEILRCAQDDKKGHLPDEIPRETRNNFLTCIGPPAAAVLIIVILTGWVFIRNKILYGEILGNRMEMTTLEPLGLIDEKTPTLSYVLEDFLPPLGTSFVAMFGQWASLLPQFVYYFYLALLVAGLAGVVILLIRKKIPSFITFLLIVALLSALGAVFYYNLTFTQPQGRLLFPVIGAIAVLCAVGLKYFVSSVGTRFAQRVVFAALILALLAIDVLAVVHLDHFYHDSGQYALAFIAGKAG